MVKSVESSWMKRRMRRKEWVSLRMRGRRVRGGNERKMEERVGWLMRRG